MSIYLDSKDVVIICDGKVDNKKVDGKLVPIPMDYIVVTEIENVLHIFVKRVNNKVVLLVIIPIGRHLDLLVVIVVYLMIMLIGIFDVGFVNIENEKIDFVVYEN